MKFLAITLFVLFTKSAVEGKTVIGAWQEIPRINTFAAPADDTYSYNLDYSEDPTGVPNGQPTVAPTAVPTAAPTAPYLFDVKVSGDFRPGNTIDVNWRSQGIMSYEIQLSKGEDGDVMDSVTSVTSESYSLALYGGLSQGNDYRVKVMQSSDPSVYNESDTFSIIGCGVGWYCDPITNPIECNLDKFEVCVEFNMSAPDYCTTNDAETDPTKCFNENYALNSGNIEENPVQSCELTDGVYFCTCNGLWVGDYCSDKQNIAISHAIGILSFIFSIFLLLPCLCFDGVWFTAEKFQTKILVPAILKVEGVVKEEKKSVAKSVEVRQPVPASDDTSTLSEFIERILWEGILQSDAEPEHVDGDSEADNRSSDDSGWNDEERLHGEQKENANTRGEAIAGSLAIGASVAEQTVGASEGLDADGITIKERLQNTWKGSILPVLSQFKAYLQHQVFYWISWEDLKHTIKVIVTGAGLLFGVYVGEITKMLANAFLIVNGFLKHLSYEEYTEQVEEQMKNIQTALQSFLGIDSMQWIADAYGNLVTFFRMFDITAIFLDDLKVTCEGSQAPTRLLVNILVVLFVAFMYEAHFVSFFKITTAAFMRFSNGKLQKEKNIPFLLRALILQVPHILEAFFKYTIQLLAALTSVRVFFPYHSHNMNCEDTDKALAILASMLSWVVLICTVHTLCRVFMWGLPNGVTFSGTMNPSDHIPFQVRKFCCFNKATHLAQENILELCEDQDSCDSSETQESKTDQETPTSPGPGLHLETTEQKNDPDTFGIPNEGDSNPEIPNLSGTTSSSNNFPWLFKKLWSRTKAPSVVQQSDLDIEENKEERDAPEALAIRDEEQSNTVTPSIIEPTRSSNCFAWFMEKCWCYSKTKKSDQQRSPDAGGNEDRGDPESFENRNEGNNEEGANPEMPSMIEIMILIVMEMKELKVTTIKKWWRVLFWKAKQLFKMTFGVWDDTLIEKMQIFEMAEAFHCDDESDRADFYHQDMMMLIGQNHSLLWQFAPLFVFMAKFAEATNGPPLFISPMDKLYIQPLRGNGDAAMSVLRGRFMSWLVNVLQFVFTLGLSFSPNKLFIHLYCLTSLPKNFVLVLNMMQRYGVFEG